MTETAVEGAVLPRVEFDTQVCKGCGVCIASCPEDIIEFADFFNRRGVSRGWSGFPLIIRAMKNTTTHAVYATWQAWSRARPAIR